MRKTEEIEIEKIDLDGNIRKEANKETIEKIKETIEARQKKDLPPLINPINVEEKEAGRYGLIDGKQRLVSMKELGFIKIEAFISQKHPMKDWQGHDENQADSDIHWIDYGKFYTEQHEKGMTERELAKRSGRDSKQIHEFLHAYKLFCFAGEAINLSISTAYEISCAPIDDWKLLVENSLETKAPKLAIRKMVQNCAKMKNKLMLIEVTHPVVHKMLSEFWYPLRYQIGSCDDMTEEADLRMGDPHRQERYFDADEITEEEARSKAEEQHGEFRGLKIFRRYIIYGLKRTARQIREKWT